MTTYLSPGVYVKEVPSGLASIAGVGTSTAGFIGIISSQVSSAGTSPSASSEANQPTPLRNNAGGIKGTGSKKTFDFNVEDPFGDDITKYKFFAEDGDGDSTALKVDDGKFTITGKTAEVTFSAAIPSGKRLLATYDHPKPKAPQTPTVSQYRLEQVKGEVVGKGETTKTVFTLSRYPVDPAGVVVQVSQASSQPTATVQNDTLKKVSTITLSSAPAAGAQISIDYYPLSVAAGEVQLCTNFTEFKKSFGDFSTVEGRSNLAHAVYGFFRNGGTQCFVTWVAAEAEAEADIDDALEAFAAIDEIAIVAVPGCTSKPALDKLSAHCQALGDRVAIFDAPQNASITSLKPGDTALPAKSDYAALYYPWIQVFDPATNGLKEVPPSGHIAGIYARVDTQRGVHKAPANEVLVGAAGLKTALTRAKQDGLNPQGVNCIRNLNGSILVWGARTWGGDANGEFKYVNIRRLFNYLRESIDEGTQWSVFEPNSPELWAKIRRSVTAFLTMAWRSGALFGATPQEAFFVQCDEETNPPEVRDAGQLVVKVGVAVVKPAEFVIFELSQWSGAK